MADSVRLKHQLVRSDATFFFYEGELPVKDGVLEIPTDNPDFESWARRAYLNGYTLDPDTDEPIGSIDDVLANASSKSESKKSAKSSRKASKETELANKEELKEIEKLDKERSEEGRKAQEAEEEFWSPASRAERADEARRREISELGEEEAEEGVSAAEVASSGVDKDLPAPKGKPANPKV